MAAAHRKSQPPPASVASAPPPTTAAPGEKSAQSAAPRSKAPAQPIDSEGKPDGGGKTKPIAALAKSAPESPSDLAAIQTAIEQVVKKCLPATVGVDINGVEGSGVIVTEDGYVLTAGHVSGMPGRDAYVILPDGKRLKAKTLGANESMDSGLMKITDAGPWPHAEMGRSGTLKPGEWCVAIGHPGGFQRNRPPPVRAGRVVMARSDALWTDCPLTAGDSRRTAVRFARPSDRHSQPHQRSGDRQLSCAGRYVPRHVGSAGQRRSVGGRTAARRTDAGHQRRIASRQAAKL